MDNKSTKHNMEEILSSINKISNSQLLLEVADFVKQNIVTYQDIIHFMTTFKNNIQEIHIIDTIIKRFFYQSIENIEFLIPFFEFCSENIKKPNPTLYNFLIKNLIYIHSSKNGDIVSKIFISLFCEYFKGSPSSEELNIITRDIYVTFVKNENFTILFYFYLFMRCDDDVEKIYVIQQNLDRFIEYNEDYIYKNVDDLYYDIRDSPLQNHFKVSEEQEKLTIKFTKFFKLICQDYRDKYRNIYNYNKETEGEKIGVLCPYTKNNMECEIILRTLIEMHNIDKNKNFTIFIYKEYLQKKNFLVPKEFEKNICVLPLSLNLARGLIASLNLDSIIYTGINLDIKNFILSIFDLSANRKYMWDDYYKLNNGLVETLYYPEYILPKLFGDLNGIKEENFNIVYDLPSNYQFIGIPFELDELSNVFMDFLSEIIYSTNGVVFVFPYKNQFEKIQFLDKVYKKKGENFILKLRFYKIQEYTNYEIGKFVSGCSAILDPILFTNRMAYYTSIFMNKIIITIKNSFVSSMFKEMKIYQFIKESEDEITDEINILKENDRRRWEKLINIKKYVLLNKILNEKSECN
jgi:hypothetical protein